MDIITLADPHAVAMEAADRIQQLVARKPGCRMALPAGATPLPLYRELVRRHREEGLSLAGVTVFGLDEYLGTGPDDPRSFASFFRRELLDHVDVAEANIHLLDGSTDDPRRACRLHEARLLADDGLDLAVVGIGGNGHLAFNEPAPALVSDTHVATLSLETRDRLGPEFKELAEGLSMGLGSILRARCILLLATGEGKADILARLAEPVVSTMVPASMLHLHPASTCLVDRAAATRMGA